MNVQHPVGARIVEASSRIIPADGVSIWQALKDADMSGFETVTVYPDNTATVIWYRSSNGVG